MRFDAPFAIATTLFAAAAAGCLESRELPQRTDNNCATCHGSTGRGGTALQQAAPPNDLTGNNDPGQPGVGAHSLHLMASTTHGPMPCDACHTVPETTADEGHADSLLPAEITPGSIATIGGRTPSYDADTRTCTDFYCHGAAAPVWTRPALAPCGSCHGVPPPPPHRQAADCLRCHGSGIGEDLSFVNPTRHVNGAVDFVISCDACHGTGPTGAPPPALSGQSAYSDPGVGAHATHLAGTATSRAVPCEECHRVPAAVTDPGHIDSAPPAELTFSGAAVTESTPRYDGGACTESYCHGAVFPQGGASGGTLTAPSWTAAPGTQTYCGSCHALPPPDHPAIGAAPCSDCHGSVISGFVHIINPDLHVNGVTDF